MMMYHYKESGLTNIYLKNGFYEVDIGAEEKGVSIDDMDGLHTAIARFLVDSSYPLTHEAFKFLRVELNLSQKNLGNLLGLTDQTIARYEKGQTCDIPRTVDASLRALYMESLDKSSPYSYFLHLLSNAEAVQARDKILLEEIEHQWVVAA